VCSDLSAREKQRPQVSEMFKHFSLLRSGISILLIFFGGVLLLRNEVRWPAAGRPLPSAFLSNFDSRFYCGPFSNGTTRPGACEASLLAFSHSGPTNQVMISDNVEIICMLSIVVVSMFLSRFMGLPPKRGQPYDTTDKDRRFKSWVPKSILIFWSNAVKLARVQENRAPSAS